MTNVSEIIGVGIVGLSADGGWASLAHVPALRAMPERFAIKALSASSAVSAAAAGIAHEVPYATSDSALLAARDDVDLVVVTVKVPHHRELVAHALANGKSVYCEWPLGRDLVEADAMTASAVERGVQTFVGLQARSAPALRYLRDLVADGYVGLIDEDGLSFVLDGDRVVIRLTLRRPEVGGRTVVQTVESVVTIRN